MSAPKRDDKRDAILDRAEELFTEHGFHGVTLATIAQAVGLGNAGLLHHFATKQTLYREVLRRLAAEGCSILYISHKLGEIM
ncbi:MAG TPA: TetR family transcriptional regulator, partial [Kofleriaceae bacterium]